MSTRSTAIIGRVITEWKARNNFKHKRVRSDVDAPFETVWRCSVIARGRCEVVAHHGTDLGQWAAQLDGLRASRSSSLVYRCLCTKSKCNLLRSRSIGAPLSWRPRQQTSRLGSDQSQSVLQAGSLSYLVYLRRLASSAMAIYLAPATVMHLSLHRPRQNPSSVQCLKECRRCACARFALLPVLLCFCSQASDAAVEGLYLPQHIGSCCDEEETLIIQRKLDIVIAELTEIRDILCKHKVHSHTSGKHWVSVEMFTKRYYPPWC